MVTASERARLIGAVSLVTAVVVAAISAVVYLAHNDGSASRHSDGSPGSVQLVPTSKPAKLSTAQLRRIADKIYLRVEADPPYGAFVMNINVPSSTIAAWWTVHPVRGVTVDAIKRIADRAGATLRVGPLPARVKYDPEARVESLNKVAPRLLAVLGYRRSYTTGGTRIEIPLNTIVVYRSAPDTSTDAGLVKAGAREGVLVELRHARYSRLEISTFRACDPRKEPHLAQGWIQGEWLVLDTVRRDRLG